MNKYTKVDGHNGLVRAPSGAILNTDKAGIAQAKNRKKLWKEQQEELAQRNPFRKRKFIDNWE